MERKFLKYLNLACKQWLFVSGVCLFLTSSMACTKSPQGSVEELIKTGPPNFGGALAKTFWSPSNVYQLDGSCDPIAYATEWSYDNSTWTEFPGAGGCPNGTFSLTVNFGAKKLVYVRARTKTGHTPTAIATIRLLLPPTSPQLHLANASVSDNEEGRGMQGSVESLGTAISDQTVTRGLKTSGVDAGYE